MSAYDDIIALARPISKTHPRMSARERAAQFAPFAALAGYGELISESQRDTLEKRPLSSGEAEKLNRRLIKLTQLIAQRPRIRISCFVPDGRKSGGAYETWEGAARRLDNGRLELEDGRSVPIDDLCEIQFL